MLWSHKKSQSFISINLFAKINIVSDNNLLMCVWNEIAFRENSEIEWMPEQFAHSCWTGEQSGFHFFSIIVIISRLLLVQSFHSWWALMRSHKVLYFIVTFWKGKLTQLWWRERYYDEYYIENITRVITLLEMHAITRISFVREFVSFQKFIKCPRGELSAGEYKTSNTYFSLSYSSSLDVKS